MTVVASFSQKRPAIIDENVSSEFISISIEKKGLWGHSVQCNSGTRKLLV